MLILHVLCSNKFSGAENVVLTTFDVFKNDKYDFIYCSKDGLIRNVVEEKKYKFVGCKRISYLCLKRIIKKYKPDIIHAHDFKASLICSLFSKKIKVISHIHNNATWLSKRCIRTLLFSYTCKRVNKVICVSKSIIDEFYYSSKFVDKLTIINNPFILPYISTKSKKCFDLCFCGRMEAAKNPLRFIKICEELMKTIPTLKAVLIGDGSQIKKIKGYVLKNNLSDNIKFLGFQKTPLEFVSKSKISVNTSVFEGFGLSILESLAAGVPVVCSNVGGLKDIVTNDCGYLCDTNETFCESIILLLRDDGYKKMYDSCIRRAEYFGNIANYKVELNRIYAN